MIGAIFTSSDSTQSKTNLFSLVCGVGIGMVGVIVLAGWAFDIAFLKTLLPGYATMKPNTALCFAVGGMGLFGLSRNTGQMVKYQYLPRISGCIVAAVGFVTVGEYAFEFNTGIDTFLFGTPSDATVYPGRMSPHAAINFALLGLALILVAGKPAQKRIAELLTFVVLFVTLGAIMGYVYGAREFFGISAPSSMAIHTVLAFAIFIAGLLKVNTHGSIVSLFTSTNLGGQSVRRLLPTFLIISALITYVRMAGQNHGLYDMGFGAALAGFTAMVFVFVIVILFSRQLEKSDIQAKAAVRELEANERRFRDLFDHSLGMICIHNLDGILTTVNPAVLRSLGAGYDDLIGKNLCEFLPPDEQAGFPAFVRKIANEGIATGLFPMIAVDGREVIWRYNSILVTEDDGEQYVVGHAQDVTDLIRAQKQLKKLSLTDDLTGLYNRRGFLTMAEQQMKLETHSGTARGLTLLFGDMDGLKKINDQYGHEAGSDAIIQLSKTIKSALRSADLVARWGGDEFVILTIGAIGEDCQTVVDRINAAIAEYNNSSSKPYRINCSIGVKPLPVDDSRTIESVIAEADKAMYEEKRRRRATSQGSPLSVPQNTATSDLYK